MARRRSSKMKFDTKTIVDVGLASVATRLLPVLLQKFVPIDPQLSSLVGAGGTFLLGNALNKPVMANSAIALGVVEFITPMIDDLVGGVIPGGVAPVGMVGGVSKVPMMVKAPVTSVADYISLNDGSYIPYPVAGSSRDYAHGY